MKLVCLFIAIVNSSASKHWASRGSEKVECRRNAAIVRAAVFVGDPFL